MFTSARKSMPAIDYVSIVKSVYTDRRAMVMGALACVLGAAVCAIKSGHPLFWGIAAGFVLITAYRFVDMTRFREANIGASDVEAAARWEVRATYGAAAFAFLSGFWCLASFVAVADPIVDLIAVTITMGCMVGVVTRNFGLDRLLTIQLLGGLVLISGGLVLANTPYHWFLAGTMAIALVSFRFLAADVRQVLLNAVHSRVEASRLAEELDTALDTMQHGLCMLDADGLIAVANDRAEAVFADFSGGKWTGRPFSALISAAAARGSVPQRAAERLMDTVRTGEGGKVMLRLPDARYVEVTVSSRQDRTVLLFEDITERVMAEERINFMAHYDVLTGLPNRAFFTEQVEADLDRRRQERSKDFATLMIVDIDDFKHVNDTLGHLVGDNVLVETAERLRRTLPAGCLVARLGGDEFIVYRSGVPADAEPTADATAILAAFRTTFNVMDEVFASNVSIGVVRSADPLEDLDALMTKADLALYKAKNGGKSQVQVFHDEMDTDYRYRQRLKAELRLCVEEGGLSLVYQPIVDLRTRHVVSCEALCRWTHPELGPIPPSEFIPLAEESGLVSEISRWVLMSATKECRNWPEDVSVSVNISARDFRDGDVAAMVGDALAASGIDPHRLELEITETALVEERAAATEILSRLAEQGIGIALDDFGTGYSSLSYLQALPFTKLKIDRSFVVDITHNPRSLRLLANVAQLGKDINLAVTAEGIETDEQLSLIRDHTRVDQIQGYLFGVPLPAREVAEVVHRMAGAEQPASGKNRKVG